MGILEHLTTAEAPKLTRVAKRYREYLRREAKIGGTLFGQVAAGGQREFFCFDENAWLWHEEWVSPSGTRHHVTTKYEVSASNGVSKFQNGVEMSVSKQEAANLLQAAKNYQRRTTKELYSASR